VSPFLSLLTYKSDIKIIETLTRYSSEASGDFKHPAVQQAYLSSAKTISRDSDP
jgi:hypothetical protein